jgi:hypothetical protein
VSQIGGESSFVESLITHRKREGKAATKSSIAPSETSAKTFGGKMGKPGTEFKINGIKFMALNKKQGNNRVFLCH